MVVPPLPRWSPRTAALALVILLLVPMAPVAAQEDVDPVSSANWLLKVKQGEAKILVNGKQTWFLDNRSQATVQTAVYNHGNASSPTVPVYFWFSDLHADPNQDTLPVKCVGVVVPPAQPTAGGFAPGIVNASWTFAVPANIPEVGYNITISVNQPPSAFRTPAPAVSRFDSNCPPERHGTLGLSGVVIDPVGPHHVSHAYFVKDKRLDLAIQHNAGDPGIRWCVGEPQDGECDATMNDQKYPYVWNRTVHPQKPNEGTPPPAYVPNHNQQQTYFQVNVTNVGTWEDATDYGSDCRCKGFPYDVRIVVTGHGYAANTTIAWAQARANGTGWHTVGNMSLREKAGPYIVNVTIDPTNASNPRGRLPEVTTAAETENNRASRAVDVMWLDFAAGINATDFRTDPATPYPYDTDFIIEGNVTLENLGPAPLMHPESNTTEQDSVISRVSYRITIPGTNFTKTGTFDKDDDQEGESPGIDFRYANIFVRFAATSVPDNTGYIRPGNHKLVVEIDTGDLSYELNETNNRKELDIYVADASAPIVRAGPILTEPDVHDVALTKARPLQPFAIRATVDDDDVDNLDVVARFTLQENASRQRNYTLTPVFKGSNQFHALVEDFRFDGNGTMQNWTYVLEANDTFGNKATKSGTKLVLEKYPLQSVPADWIVRQYADGAAFEYSESDPIAYQIRAYQNWTGVTDQANVTSNLLMWVTPAGAQEINISAGWRNLTECTERVDPPKLGDLPTRTYVCNPGNDYFSNFQNIISRASGDPGVWNVSVGIRDASGEIRYVNRTIFLTDAAPVLVTQDVLTRDPTNVWRSTRSADKGETIWVSANFTDDQTDPMEAYANFSRPDGQWRNFTLSPKPVAYVANATGGPPTPYFLFNSSIEVGQAKALGLGGELNLTIAVRDSTGNWVRTTPIVFKVNDTQVPVLADAKATPAIQEVGQDVTFTVHVTDETNVTATVSIQSGDTDVLPPTPMSTADGRNFTFTTSLGIEGNYAWTIAVRDSVNQASQQTGTLAIRDNLGPRFEVRSPGDVAPDGMRYGTALPRIEIVAFDSDTVDAASIALTVDGQPVVPELGPAPPGLTGVTLSYQVPSSRRFFHGEEVAVNVTAKDGSAKRLDGYLNFTFRVDDVAPTTRLASFTPQYRDQASDDWNVSLETVFRFEASDEDNLPTGIAAIRYRILVAGGSTAENLYTAPFRIRDVGGVYRGPTVYTLEYWAEDTAGNVNGTRLRTRVYVDDAPPDLIQYFPQGIFINATFVDEQVGVERAVAWHRVNAEPYQPLALEPAGNNLWKGVLPEGRKGDRVSYYLQAWDRLGNTQTFGNASDPKASFSATNHNPSIRVTSPVTGSRVSGNFNLEWNASDEDGDALTFIVSVKSPGREGYQELATLDASETRRYPVDSRRFLDGEHVFRVSANDGGVVKHSEVTLRVLNRADPLVGVSPITGEVVPGGTVLIKAEVAKAQAVVEARLYLEGKLVGSYPMNDEGREGDEVANDGVYSVRAPVDASGDYSVEIVTQYQEDGVTKTSTRSDAITFSARMTPGYILKEYAVLLVLIAVAAAVAIGIAAWAVVRKRG